jgi:shikimate kinase
MAPRNLVLIGFMGAGKSTLGRRCACELGYRFFDTDRMVAQRAGKSIPDIFAQDGEAAFRELEAAAVRDLARMNGLVIATGGGVPMNALNIARLRRSGVLVLIWLDSEELVSRTEHRTDRPLLANAEDPRTRISQLLEEREPAYRAAAHVVVETSGLTTEDATQAILSKFRQWLDSQEAPAAELRGVN